MNRIYWLLVVLQISICITAQIVTQKGVVYQYNGKNPRTPLGKVYLKVLSSSNAVLSDSKNGEFEFLLRGVKMGSPLGPVTAAKKGMMVFNQQAVDEWNVRQAPLVLVMCDANEYERQRQNLIKIVEKEAQKRYDEKIKKIEAKYEAESYEWYKKVCEADSSLQEVRKHLGEFADLFARIDESEIDTIAQQALELFRKGCINEAISKFEEGHLLERLKQVNQAIIQGETIISNVHKEVEKTKKDKELYIKSIRAQVDAYRFSGDWIKLGQLLKGLADETRSYEDVNEYVKLSKHERRWDDALSYNIMLSDIIENQKEDVRYLERKALLYLSFSNIYDGMNVIEKHRDACFNAVEYYERLIETDWKKYCRGYAASLRNLGVYYERCNQLDEAILESKKSLNQYLKIDSFFPETCTSDIAALQNNIGLIFSRQGDQKEAIKLISSALEIYRDLSKLDHETWDGYLSYPLTDLGVIRGQLGQYEEAERLFKEALDIRYGWALRNPLHAEPLFKKTLIQARRMYNLPDNNRKDVFLGTSLKLYRQLSAKMSDHYSLKLAEELSYAGKYYWENKEYHECLKTNLDLLDLSKMIAGSDTIQNQYIGMCYMDLGVVYHKLKFYDLSEQSFYKATDIFRQLCKRDTVFKHEFAGSVGSLSWLNILHGRFQEAERHAQEGLLADSAQYFIAINLAMSFLVQGKLSRAEDIYVRYKRERKRDILDSFMELEKAGVIPSERMADVERIKKMLNE